jgi:23S rRNA pseudouridine1911/1915/1917 synthase
LFPGFPSCSFLLPPPASLTMPRFSIEPNPRITFRVYHEDADVVVVSKSAGVVTTPGLGHDRDSLLNGLFARWGTRLQNLGRERDFGLLHRLDRETSGLVLCALSTRAYEVLRQAFEGRRVEKYYWAVTPRTPERASGVIRANILEFEGPPEKGVPAHKLARIDRSGKPALTAYRVLSRSPLGAVLECRAVTGRLHQVRVHLESIGCPILGDEFYAPRALRKASRRLALHAHRLAFAHPVSGERIDVRTAWPRDLRGLLTRLGLPRPDVPSGVKGAKEIHNDAVGDENA